MWYQRRQPEEIIKSPWLSEEATDYLEGILSPDFSVIEHGGGGSTLWLAERVRRVATYENNSKWYDTINALRPPNVSLRFSSFYFEAEGQCDLLFIDGDPVENRKDWIAKSTDIATKWIVIDNANRPEYEDEIRALRDRATLVKQTQAPGGRYFVTEFYKCE